MNRRLRSVGVAAAASMSLLLASCGTGASEPSAAGNGPAQLQIVASFYPFQYIAEQVAGDHAVVTNLTQPGAEPHDLELTPKQVGRIGEADLVIYEKSFQAAVDEAVEQSGNEHVFDTTTAVPLRDLGTQDEEHADEGPGHSDRYLDPHVWLDPVNVATLATALAEKLSAQDPEHATDYASNAASLKTELTALDEDFRTGLTGCARTQFITQHAAFGYLADRYRLTQIAIGGLSPDVEPSPSRIAEVQRQATADGITTIFYETLVSPAVAQAIAGDLGLKTDVLDPIEGITPESKGQDYLAVMKANLASLKTANGCR
ncbi:MAG: metal ABC transporter substrate-binding protein [Propionibacteriaceae bacterium]